MSRRSRIAASSHAGNNAVGASIGSDATNDAVRRRFTVAVDALVESLRDDDSVLAAILCGSLSHDTVWARSDVDLVLVTVDDRKLASSSVALNADGVNVHALLLPRADFRRTVEGSPHQSFMHSFLAKGRLLYTHDTSIATLFAGLQDIGERDTQLQLLRAGTEVLAPLYKAHKWFVTRRDLDYTALWILYAATSLARIEVVGHRLLADREVIPQALQLNPAFFSIVYSDLLNEAKTVDRVSAALQAIDAYVAERAPSLFAPITDYLREAGEPRAASEIEEHFVRHFGVGSVTTACEYLADCALIGKASIPSRLTKRSHVDVQEMAFFHLGTRA